MKIGVTGWATGITDNERSDYLRMIAALGPDIKVQDISSLVAAEAKDTSQLPDLDAALAGVEVLYGLRFPRKLIERAPDLKWVQMMSAGVDISGDIVRSPVVVTNFPHPVPLAEYAVMMMLMLVKQAPAYAGFQRERRWQRFPLPVLRGKTLGIVGYGHIGQETARLARPFGMRVLATRRSAKRPAPARYADLILPPADLSHLLAESDFVVISLALTAETRHIIGEDELNAMKPTAYLINVARGSVVNEPVLIRALEEKRIAGAALDVFEQEPLAADSRLWSLPNVIMTPHVAGTMTDYNRAVTEAFCRNLSRYLASKRLQNVVRKSRGY